MSIGFGDALSIVQLGLQLLKDVGAAGEQLDLMKLRMIDVQYQLTRAREIVTNKTDEGRLKELSPAIFQHAKDAVDRLEIDVKKINKILRAWINQDLGFGGLTIRYKKVSDLINGVLKGGGDKLESFNKRLDQHQSALSRCVQDLIYEGIRELLRKPTPTLKPVTIHRPRTPSPGPRSPTKIIFVDESNTRCSVIAQSYLYLVQQWTTRTRNAFNLSKISSAGLLVHYRSAYIDHVTTLRNVASDRITRGDQIPSSAAINALFNQRYFNYAYKPPIHKSALARRSRGVPIDLFSGYDVIFVFNRADRGNLEDLREKLNNVAPMWRTQNKRARIQLLGDYGKHAQPQIRPVFKANCKDEAEETREWEKVVGNIKTSVKAFLIEQTGWKVPKKEDSYLQGETLDAAKVNNSKTTLTETDADRLKMMKDDRANVKSRGLGVGTEKPRKPDIAKPDIDKPDTMKADTAMANSKRSGNMKPDSKKPKTAKHDNKEPGTAKPDTKKTDTGKPEAKKLNNNKAKTSNLNTKTPEINKPDTKKPDSKPDIKKPNIVNPDLKKMDTTKPDTTKLDIAKPDTQNPGNKKPDTKKSDTKESDIEKPKSKKADTKMAVPPQSTLTPDIGKANSHSPKSKDTKPPTVKDATKTSTNNSKPDVIQNNPKKQMKPFKDSSQKMDKSPNLKQQENPSKTDTAAIKPTLPKANKKKQTAPAKPTTFTKPLTEANLKKVKEIPRVPNLTTTTTQAKAGTNTSKPTPAKAKKEKQPAPAKTTTFTEPLTEGNLKKMKSNLTPTTTPMPTWENLTAADLIKVAAAAAVSAATKPLTEANLNKIKADLKPGTTATPEPTWEGLTGRGPNESSCGSSSSNPSD